MNSAYNLNLYKGLLLIKVTFSGAFGWLLYRGLMVYTFNNEEQYIINI